MNENCEQVKEMILSSFQNNIQVSLIEEGCIVTLPLLDPLNDYIQFYVVPMKEGYRLTDFGETIEKLRGLNLEINTPKRESIFEAILETNGVSYSKGMLSIDVEKNFSDFQKKILLYIKAITATYDLEHLKEPHIRLDFKEVVWQHLQEKEYEFIPNFLVSTPVVERISVDFCIGDNILLNTLHAATISYARVVINQIHTDFSTIRKYVPHYHRILIYNDESPVSESPRFNLLGDVLEIPPIPWKERETGLKKALALV